MAKGIKTGGGSRKGIPNRHPIGFRATLREYCERIGANPHFLMAEIVADTHADAALRLNAAKELAKYLEPQLKSVDHSGSLALQPQTPENLR
jgi:hypothetical protein